MLRNCVLWLLLLTLTAPAWSQDKTPAEDAKKLIRLLNASNSSKPIVEEIGKSNVLPANLNHDAANKLIAMGDKCLQQLEETIAGKNKQLCLACMVVVARIGLLSDEIEKISSILLSQLANRDKDIRMLAIVELSMITHRSQFPKDKAAAALNRIAIEDPVNEARQKAVLVMREMGLEVKIPVTPERIADLIAALLPKQPGEIAERLNCDYRNMSTSPAGIDDKVANELINIGDNAVPQLLHQLKDSQRKRRLLAMIVLSRIGANTTSAEAGTKIVAAFAGLLADSDKQVAYSAILGLGIIGAKAQKTMPQLIKLIASSDRQVVHNAIFAVTSIKQQGEAAIPVLMRRIEDNNNVTKQFAIVGLGEMREMSVQAAPAMAAALAKEKSVDVKRALINALAKIGNADNKTLPVIIKPLVENLLSPNKELRDETSQIIMYLGKPALELLKKEAQSSKNDRLTEAINQIIGNMEKK